MNTSNDTPLTAFLIEIGWVRGAMDARNDAGFDQRRLFSGLFIPALFLVLYLLALLGNGRP